MFQRRDVPSRTYGFLVAVEVQEGGPTPEQISLKLADATAWVEGCGQADVESLGEIDLVDDSIEVK